MTDAPQIGYVGPLAPIIGAIVGALITAVVGYFILAKRKRLTLWISDTDDITAPLRRHHREILFRIGQDDLVKLNRSRITVKNSGNTALGMFTFDVKLPGDHQHYYGDLAPEDAGFRDNVVIEWPQPRIMEDPVLTVKVSPFLNARETFSITTYFDGDTEPVEVRCRIEDVTTRIKRGEYAPFWATFAKQGFPIMLTIGASAAVSGSAILAWLAELFKKTFLTAQ